MQPFVGIGLKVLSALVFTVMSASVKALGDRYPTGELVFFRSAFALVPLLLWLGWQRRFSELRTRNLKGHLLRGVIGSGGMFAGFLGLAYLPLTDAVAIGYAAPLIVVVLAALVLRERVRVYRWSAVVVGFAGVLVMLSPHLGQGLATAPGSSGLGALFALVGACCAAGATIQVRRLTETEPTGAIVFYFTLLTTTLGALTLLFAWRTPSAGELAPLVLIGVLGGIGQILLTQSYRFADASLVAPFDYTTMIWALLIGWFVFGQLPQAAVVLGGIIVAAAGLFVIWRERQLGLMRTREAEAGSQRPT